MIDKHLKLREVTSRGRGRPKGRTAQGERTRQRLFETAIALVAEKGYVATTLREIADRASVSVGLLYKYFPSKSAVVLSLYDALSLQFAERAEAMPSGTWADRSLFSLRMSLEVLGPHRKTLAALQPIFFGDGDDNLFAPRTAFSRDRVQGIFLIAVTGASDAPSEVEAKRLARLLYFLHLATILWWLLDKSPAQRATQRLLDGLAKSRRYAAFALSLPFAKNVVTGIDELLADAIFTGAEERSRP